MFAFYYCFRSGHDFFFPPKIESRSVNRSLHHSYVGKCPFSELQLMYATFREFVLLHFSNKRLVWYWQIFIGFILEVTGNGGYRTRHSLNIITVTVSNSSSLVA